jgi:predicted transcriptional regulator
MTMLSFRLDAAEAGRVREWAARLEVDVSTLVREAVRRRLDELASEADARAWAEHPLSAGELELAGVSDWGPAEDWSDWAGSRR